MSSPRPRLVVARRMPEAVGARIAAEFDAPEPGGADVDIETAIRLATQTAAPALMISSNLKFDAAAIGRLPSTLRILATTSVGTEHLDIVAGRARGLVMTNTPDVLTDCTADLTWLLILAACRRAHEYEAIMRAGWGRGFGLGDLLGVRVTGRTLGIVGLGRIGRAVARRAAGFAMPVLYTGTRRRPAEEERGAEYVPELHAMLARTDVLTLHAPATADTVGLMDAAAFAALKAGAVFINAARGTLVDEDALIATLQSGRLAAAGLDVYRNEPHPDPRFGTLSNVFLTPHMGSATVETRNAMGFRALDNITAVLDGRPALDPLW